MLLIQSSTLAAYYASTGKAPVTTQLLRALYDRPSLVVLSVAALIILVDLSLLTDGLSLPSFLMTASLLLEATPPVSQYLRIRSAGTTQGVSPVMVGSWLLGDVAKVCYFGALKSEPKMAVGGALAAAADAVVVGRVWRGHGHGE